MLYHTLRGLGVGWTTMLIATATVHGGESPLVELAASDSYGISAFALDSDSGGLRWWKHAADDEPNTSDGTVRVMPTLGGGTQRIARSATLLDDPNYRPNFVRDEAYVYFFEGRQLHRKALNAVESDPSQPLSTAPQSPTLPAWQPSSPLAIHDGSLFWSRYDQSSGQAVLYIMPVDASRAPAVVGLYEGGGPVTRLEYVVFRDEDRRIGALVFTTENRRLVLRKIARSTEVLHTNVDDFTFHTLTRAVIGAIGENTRAFIAYNPPGQAGRVRSVNLRTLEIDDYYRADGLNRILSVATDGDSFWGAQPPPTNIYAAERHGQGTSVLRRRMVPPGIGTPPWEPILLSEGGFNLRSDDHYLYYIPSEDFTDIRRIPTDAPALELDVATLAVEVVQAVQSLLNDVPLVADKPTFVRAYAYVTKNTTGQSAWLPRGILRGFRGATELEGSPLSSLESPIIGPTVDLGILRAHRDRGYLFRLPEEWTRPGDLRLRVEVNPGGFPETGADPYSNNVEERTVAFQAIAPPCLRAFPLETNAPMYTHESPGFPDILERAASLLPVPGFDVRPLAEPLRKPVAKVKVQCSTIPIPPFYVCVPAVVVEHEPFQMPDDRPWSLVWTAWRNLNSADPPGCVRTHWLAMAHGDAGGTDGWGGVGGVPGMDVTDIVPDWPSALDFAIPDTPVNRSLVVRMIESAIDAPGAPLGGRTLAHELGHNCGRRHVNQFWSPDACGGTEPDVPIDHDYPYDECRIGLANTSAPDAYFAFDPLTLTVIHPHDTGDLMSYAENRWPADVTWKAIFESLRGGGGGRLPADRGAGGAIPEGDYLLAGGLIAPYDDVGAFLDMVTLPHDAIDADKVERSLAASAQLGSSPAYLLRQVGPGEETLDESGLVVTRGLGSGEPILGFLQWVPYDSRTARLDLIATAGGGTVLAEHEVSGSAPQLQLDPPGISGNEIALSWTASDADGDDLSFMILHSSDGGASWQSIAVGLRFEGAILDASALPGSAATLLRVVASDGSRSSMATTAPFALAPKPPRPMISGVRPEERVSFDRILLLRGTAIDPEEGTLAGEALAWRIDGPTVAAGEGRSLLLTDLAPGRYEARLEATDGDAQRGETSVDFEVLAPEVPDAGPPVLDGLPNDSAYGEALEVTIPLAGGESGRAWLVHADGALYVCLDGLRYRTITIGGFLPPAGIYVDVDASGGPAVGAGDIGFLVDQNGVPSQAVPVAGRLEETLSPALGYRAVVARGPDTWTAELRIDEELIGGWGHASRVLLLGDEARGDSVWPVGASRLAPDDWALVWLGSAPEPENRPPVADAGPDQVVRLDGPWTVYLDGSASQDPDGLPLSFEWAQVGGPPFALDAESGSSTASFDVPVVPAGETVATFRLTVSDGAESGADTVTVRLIPEGVEPPDGFLRSDCNEDGKTDISDAVFTLGSLFLGTGDPACVDACDSNDDGRLDVSDPIATLGVLFLGQGSIPDPGMSACGPDPTGDGLGCASYGSCP